MNRNCGCVSHTAVNKVELFMGHIKAAAEIRKDMTQEEKEQADIQLEAFADIA